MKKENVFEGLEVTKEMLTNLRQSINNSYYAKEFDLMIEKSQHLLNLVEQATEISTFDRVYNSWVAYHQLADTYYDLGHYNDSLDHYAKALAIIYADNNMPTLVYHGHLSKWNMARVYNKLNLTTEAIRMYDECILFYSNLESDRFKLAGCVLNKGEILSDVRMLLGSIELYQSIDYKEESVSVYEVLTSIDEAYRIIVNIYLNNGDMLNATRYAKQIKGADLREKCLQLIGQ